MVEINPLTEQEEVEGPNVEDRVAFRRARQAQVETQVDIAKPRPSAFEPYDFTNMNDEGEAVTNWDSFSAAMVDNGILMGLFGRDKDVVVRPDPNFSLEDAVRAGKGDAEVLDKYQRDPNGGQSQAVFARLEEIQNHEEYTQFMARLRESERLQKEAWVNPVFGVLGTIAGVGVDIVPTLLAGGGVTALTGALRAGTSIKAITAGIRAQGAARVGTVGALEGGGERIVHSMSNPLVTGDEILLGATFGGVIGGSLGALFPRAVGGVFRDLAFDVPSKYSDEVLATARAERGLAREGDDSVGSMRVPGTNEVIAPGRGAGGLGVIRAVNKLPGLRNINMERWLRNPKRVLVDIGIDGLRQFKQLGLIGNRNYYDRMNRLLRVGIANDAEVAGTGVRPPSVEDVRLFYKDTMHALESESQRTYNDMIREVYGSKHFANMRAQLRNSESATLGSDITGIKSSKLKAADFERMADELSNLRAKRYDGLPEDAHIPAHIKAALDERQLDSLKKWIEQQSRIDDEYYQMMGKMEVDTGLIKPEELIPGYRPQVWNKDAIISNREGYKNFLRKVFRDNPEPKWLQKHYVPKDAQGKDVAFETIEDLDKLDPALGKAAREEWDIALREGAIEKKAQIEELKQKELKKFRADSIEEIESKWESASVKMRSTLEKKEQQFASAKDPKVVERLAKEIGKLEVRLADGEKKLTVVRALDQQSKEADAFILKFGSPKVKKTFKKVRKGVEKSAKATVKEEAREIIDAQLDKIVDNILSDRAVNHELSLNSGRFMHRSIDLGAHRHTDEARSFLDNNAGVARRIYDQQAAPQIALRRVFGTAEELGAETTTEYGDALRKQMLEGYDEDLAKLEKGSKEAQRVARDRQRSSDFFDNVMNQLTGAEGVRSDFGRVASQISGVGTSLTATMLLGGVAISQLSDIAVMALAGGRAGVGFKALGKIIGKELKNMDDVQMSIVLRGSNTVDMGRFKALYDLDDDVYVAGGRLARIRRIVDEVGVLEGYANLMHVWNRKIRSSFGVDFARQMDTHFADFDNLSPDLKRFYAKHGIGSEDAREIADMMNKSSDTIMDGMVRIPKTTEWSRARPDLYMKYRIALRSAGDEALLDPGLADRPFMRASALGRIILQFSSFMFTAADKFIPVLAQEARLNWKQSQVMFAVFATAMAAPLVSGIQAYRYGKLEEWADKWDDPSGAGVRDNLWDALSRSPLMAGHSGTIMDLFQTFGAPHANDAIAAGTGMRPFKEDATRFKMMQGLGAAAGALPGTVNSAFKSMQDYDKFMDFASKRTPILNVFYLQMITNAMKDQ